MIILWVIFLLSLVIISLLLWVGGKRMQGKSFPKYDTFLINSDKKVRKGTFRTVRKIIVWRDMLLRDIQKWLIAFFHIMLEVIHFVSAKFNKILVRMKHTTRKKAYEMSTKEPSDFLKKMKEE